MPSRSRGGERKRVSVQMEKAGERAKKRDRLFAPSLSRGEKERARKHRTCAAPRKEQRREREEVEMSAPS
eukprot:1255994-Rhodomonas_salina.1